MIIKLPDKQDSGWHLDFCPKFHSSFENWDQISDGLYVHLHELKEAVRGNSFLRLNSIQQRVTVLEHDRNLGRNYAFHILGGKSKGRKPWPFSVIFPRI